MTDTSLEIERDCLWSVTSPLPPDTSELTDIVDTDVVVIGAGYTGLSTALHLAEAGVRSVVIEAKSIGYGGSGRNAGHCTPLFQHTSIDGLRRTVGQPWADRMIDMQTNAGTLVFDLITRHTIECDAVKSGFLQVAHSPGHMRQLEQRAADYAGLGHEVRLLDASHARQMTGSPTFHGGWMFMEAGNLNPLAYARGLAAAAIRLGVQIFTGSPAESVTKTSSNWLVSTSRGHVRADKVVIATGAYENNLWPGLSRSFLWAQVACMASQPLDQSALQNIIPQRQHVLDTRGDFTNIRLDRDGRLVTSLFVEGARGGDIASTKRMMSKKFAGIFPDLPVLDWEYYWFGSVDLHPRTFPQLFNLAPGVTSAVGYSSRGVPTATAMGRQLAKHCTVAKGEDLAVEVLPLTKVPFGFGAAVRTILPLYRIRDSLKSVFAG